MSKLKNLKISFGESDSPDVVAYKLYIEESPNPVTYDSESFELGNNTTIDMSTLPGIDTKDGVFNIGIVAIDDAGNESAMSKASDVPLDFIAPNPPGEIVIERS